MDRRHLSRGLWVAALFWAAGCGDEVTALDISLVPNPVVNDPRQVLAELGAVELVVDSETGLYPAGTQWQSEIAQLADVDSDGELELQARIDLGGFDSLPAVRLERGSMPELGIELRAEGVARQDGRRIAKGGAMGVGFSPGVAVPVRVEFNILSQFLPPQVFQTIPERGAVVPPATVRAVFVTFSNKMSEPSLQRSGVVELLRRDEGGEVLVLVPRVGDLVVASVDTPKPITTAYYRLDPPLGGGRYVVRVSREAEDLERRQLDQIPLQPGSEGFSAEFEVEGPSHMSAMDPVDAGKEMGGCDETGCVPGMRCGGSGLCLPTTCPASCEAGAIRDPAYPLCDGASCESVPLCVPDCRPYGSYGGCSEERPVCNPETGVCEAGA